MGFEEVFRVSFLFGELFSFIIFRFPAYVSNIADAASPTKLYPISMFARSNSDLVCF